MMGVAEEKEGQEGEEGIPEEIPALHSLTDLGVPLTIYSCIYCGGQLTPGERGTCKLLSPTTGICELCQFYGPEAVEDLLYCWE